MGLMATTAEKSAELVGRLERLPFSRWHRNLFALCFLGVMFDACDFALFGMALPPVAREFGLNPAQAGLLATLGLVGAFLGALFWGTISDYIGRRTSFAATIGIFSLFTGLVAASWNVLSLAVFRFISNFGLGGEVPVALTLTSEYSPGRIRGRMTGSMMAAFPLGLALEAALAYLIIRGRVAEAEATVAHIEQQALAGQPAPAAPVNAPVGVEERGVTVFELL